MAGRQKKKRQIKYFDYSLLFIIIFLICFGLVMLYSTSAYDAQNTFKDPAHYLKRQAMAFGLGLVGMFVISRIDYRRWKNMGTLAYLVALVLCSLVLIPGIGIEHNGSRRWLGIPNSSMEFQPSEFAKLAVIGEPDQPDAEKNGKIFNGDPRDAHHYTNFRTDRL